MKLFPTLVIDDFLDDPDYLSDLARSVEYKDPSYTNHPGVASKNAIHEIEPELFDTINNKTIADTLNAPFAGKITFEYVKKYVDEILNVSEEEMIESLRIMIERLKVVPEPSASACFVPIVYNKLKIPSQSKCLVVVCGGNIDLKKIKSLF